ncbi:MAG: GNAT family N-acetyltransferase [Verrucomicrobiota bacterium]
MACLGIPRLLDRSRETHFFALAHENPKHAIFQFNGDAQGELQPWNLAKKAMKTEWRSRELGPRDQTLLWDLLYIALWDAPEEPRRPRTVLDRPAIRKLVENWGRPEDFGLLAVDLKSKKEVGGIWARLDGYDDLEGYGCGYPCLGIAVNEENQNRGAGSFLMSGFIGALRGRVDGLRLGVNPRNMRAIGLYEKFGFKQYALGAGDYPQMKLDLNDVEKDSGGNG